AIVEHQTTALPSRTGTSTYHNHNLTSQSLPERTCSNSKRLRQGSSYLKRAMISQQLSSTRTCISTPYTATPTTPYPPPSLQQENKNGFFSTTTETQRPNCRNKLVLAGHPNQILGLVAYLR